MSVGRFAQDRAALGYWSIAPHRKGPARCIQCAVKIGLGGFRQVGNYFAGGGVDDMVNIAALDLDPFAINMKLQ